MLRTTALLLLMLSGMSAKCTHFLGAEIRYALLTGSTYQVEVILYSDLTSPADRPEVLVDFGDGMQDTVPRTTLTDHPANGSCWSVRVSSYGAVHTYSGPGTYLISFVDANRNSGINNIPNSVTQPACLGATLVVNPSFAPNTSPQFDTLQFVTHRNWNTLVHDPGASDPEGDSLTFELIAPNGLDCAPITGYQLPLAANFIWLDPTTGVLLWDYPTLLGNYVVAIRCSEWRNGMMIGQVTRDMQICVSELPTGIAEVAPTAPVTHASIADGSLRLMNRATTPVLAEFVAMTGALQARVQLPPGEYVLDIASWASGMYVLRTTASDGTTGSSRLVKR